jgi:hypothetical protein
VTDSFDLRHRIERALGLMPLLCATVACTSASKPPRPETTVTRQDDEPDLPSCPSGKWCGPVEAARAKADPGQEANPVQGCPPALRGSDEALAETPPPVYDDLPLDGLMYATLDEQSTAERRKAGDVDACCYTWTIACPGGRPLLQDDEAVVADLRTGGRWCDFSVEVAVSDLPTEVRQAIAEGWLEDARAEHASIAAFARATLELLALGAPPALVAGCQTAALDEIRHARHCFALAAAYGGVALEPAGLPAASPRAADLVELACNTFVEGCVGETIAALVAARALHGVTDPTVRRVLIGIRDDEADHAALAWQTIAWTLEQGGSAVRRALAKLAIQLRRAGHPTEPPTSAKLEQRSLASEHGRLTPAEKLLARDDAWRDIIEPLLHATLDGAGEHASNPPMGQSAAAVAAAPLQA